MERLDERDEATSRPERSYVWLVPTCPILPKVDLGSDGGYPKGLRVWLEVEEGVEHARLLHLFRETWRTMPLWVRRRIVRLWRRVEEPVAPRVRLVKNLALVDRLGHELVPLLDGMLGCVNCRGRLVRFSAWWVDRLSDDGVRTLIAHELAHVLARAQGGGHEAEADLWDEHVEIEQRLYAWGFDEMALDEEIAQIKTSPSGGAR